MSRQTKPINPDAPEPLDTIWEVPDDLWLMIAPLVAQYDPPARTGRKRVDARACLNALVFRMRTGCQWNHLPSSFPDDSTVHRTFQRWVTGGLFQQIWARLVQECQDLDGVDWAWQAADDVAPLSWSIRSDSAILQLLTKGERNHGRQASHLYGRV